MIWLLLGCVRHPEAETSGARVHPKALLVAPVVKVQDLPAPPIPPLGKPGEIEAQLVQENLPTPTILDPVQDAAFIRNAYIGNILFGGGLIRSGDVALEVRSRLIEFNQQAEDATQGTRWLHDTLAGVLDEKKVDWKPIDAPNPVPVPEWVAFRGLHPEDGHDNVNIPRTNLRPTDWTAAPPGDVLIPYLRAYYTHNGGWFNGQQYGCLGGARVEVFLVLYHNGRASWWMEGTGRYFGNEGSPSRAELDQYLLYAEDQVEWQLEKQIFR